MRHLVDHCLDRLRKMIERGNRRADDRSHFRYGGHGPQMSKMERGIRVPQQHQRTSLLEMYVGARVSRLSARQHEIADRVLIEQGRRSCRGSRNGRSRSRHRWRRPSGRHPASASRALQALWPKLMPQCLTPGLADDEVRLDVAGVRKDFQNPEPGVPRPRHQKCLPPRDLSSDGIQSQPRPKSSSTRVTILMAHLE